jgi:hypothetical protein
MTFDLLAHFGISYDDARHRYERFGVRLDSVTSVLPYLAMNEFLEKHPERLEKAGDRGHAIAVAIEEREGGRRSCASKTSRGMTLSTLALDFAQRWESYEKFKHETGFQALVNPYQVATELFVYHDLLDYVGRIDLAGFAPNVCDGPGLVEVKATAVLPKTIGPQSAAYFEAFNRNAKIYGFPKLKWRASLHLTEKGYKFEPLKNPLDFARFNARLIDVRWARELGYEIPWVPVETSVSPKGDAPSPAEVFA